MPTRAEKQLLIEAKQKRDAAIMADKEFNAAVQKYQGYDKNADPEYLSRMALLAWVKYGASAILTFGLYAGLRAGLEEVFKGPAPDWCISAPMITYAVVYLYATRVGPVRWVGDIIKGSYNALETRRAEQDGLDAQGRIQKGFEPVTKDDKYIPRL